MELKVYLNVIGSVWFILVSVYRMLTD